MSFYPETEATVRKLPSRHALALSHGRDYVNEYA